MFSLASSLGGVESRVCHPAVMTHASIIGEIRGSRGVADSMVRLSIGIEDIDDLIPDLDHALRRPASPAVFFAGWLAHWRISMCPCVPTYSDGWEQGQVWGRVVPAVGRALPGSSHLSPLGFRFHRTG